VLGFLLEAYESETACHAGAGARVDHPGLRRDPVLTARALSMHRASSVFLARGAAGSGLVQAGPFERGLGPGVGGILAAAGIVLILDRL